MVSVTFMPRQVHVCQCTAGLCEREFLGGKHEKRQQALDDDGPPWEGSFLESLLAVAA